MMLLKDKFCLCFCFIAVDAMVGCRILKEEWYNWTFFCICTGHVFEGFHYLNISGIKFLFDLDNSLIWNV